MVENELLGVQQRPEDVFYGLLRGVRGLFEQFVEPCNLLLGGLSAVTADVQFFDDLDG